MEILYSDRDIIVCVKPVGLDSEHAVPEALKADFPGDIFPIHRLDLNVGGVMVYARTKPAAASLSKAVQEGTLIKEYRAIVHGTPEDSGDWEDLLWKDPKKNKVFVVRRVRGGVKKAHLTYTRLFASAEYSEVLVRLYTGRTHQIRVQFASRGFPLLGDHKYGARDAHKAPLLFSYRLTFPYKNKSLIFSKEPEWPEIR